MAKTKVLVVEDEGITAMAIANSLEEMGFEVTGAASDADEALALAAANPPDIVLMDIRIRGPVDGTEVSHLLRERQDVPVVFLTAYADEATIQRATAASPFGYVVKPYQDRDLKSSIAVALKLHSLMKERDAAHAAVIDRSVQLARQERTIQRLRAFSPARLDEALRALRGLSGVAAREPDAARALDEAIAALAEVSNVLAQLEALDREARHAP